MDCTCEAYTAGWRVFLYRRHDGMAVVHLVSIIQNVKLSNTWQLTVVQSHAATAMTQFSTNVIGKDTARAIDQSLIQLDSN